MKFISIISIGVLITASAYGQRIDKALARIMYMYIHVQDTTQKDKPHKENMLLVTGKNAWVYTSYDRLSQTFNRRIQLLNQLKNQSGNSGTKMEFKSEMKFPTTAVNYFFFPIEHKMFSNEKLVNNYIIEEPLPPINWKIVNDTARYSGILCQKALAHFKGRNWIAWFATEIPFQSGPWKLNGLPGLIIEAYDEKREVKFEFAGLENIHTGSDGILRDNQKIAKSSGLLGTGNSGIESNTSYLDSEIKLPADAIKITRKDLEKLTAARDKDPQGFMQTQMASSGIQGSFKITSLTPPSGSAIAQKVKINNPIELPENK